MACDCFSKPPIAGYQAVCTCPEPMTAEQWADEVEQLRDANRGWRAHSERLTAILHAARLCDECGKPATWELQPIADPWTPKCEEHAHPIMRLTGKRKFTESGA